MGWITVACRFVRPGAQVNEGGTFGHYEGSEEGVDQLIHPRKDKSQPVSQRICGSVLWKCGVVKAQ